MIDTTSEGQIKSFIADMNSSIQGMETDSESMGRKIEILVDDVLYAYNKLLKGDISGRGESTKTRNRQVAFANTLQFTEAGAEKVEISPIEERVMASDLLLLNYMLVTDTAYEGAKKMLSEQGKSMNETSTDEIFETMAKVCVEAINKQREKNVEDEIHKRFPDAPTTGQELEYPDPLVMIASLTEVITEDVQILETWLETGHLEGIEVQNSENQRNIVNYLLLTEDERRKKLEQHKAILASLELVGRVFRDSETGDYNTTDVEREVRSMLVSKNLSMYLDESEWSPLVKFLKTLKPIERGDRLSPTDVKILADISPTMTRMMSRTKAFGDRRELKGREYISRPSLTMRTQLADLIAVFKSGGLAGNEVNVHQTVSGAELSPKNVDFMEAHVILVACGYDLEEYDDKSVEILSNFLNDDKPTYAGDFQKMSVIDSQSYFFPYHLNRGRMAEEAVAYPEDNRQDNLVELRAMGLLKQLENFPTYVKAMTFNWLCAWGSKADLKPVDDRSEDEKYFSEVYKEMIVDWRKLLEERGVKRPNENRYYCLEEQIGTIEGELFTRYKTELLVRRELERKAVSAGQMEYKDTLEHATKQIMITFRAKMRERISLRLNEKGD